MPFDPIRAAIARHGQDAEALPEVAREASVALVLRARADTLPELLMIKRSEKEGDPWSGHMAFPGGRREPQDLDAEHTARRETREELDLDLEGAALLGTLSPVHTPSVVRRMPQLRVYAYTFGLLERPTLRPNEEVASVHWFGLERLMADEGRATFPYEWRGDTLRMPCVRLDGCFIWGMSLRMIDDLLERMRAAGMR
ncbi:MAG: CoA pyrophosphatase [Alphaproteobacteria bacterium]|nr:CoA pyrophosphatase [Alphaproteobacteria bacterium]MCB9793551.1 CoA pyrophosphatase [Alphaproteobacteria bacterium]